VENHCKGSTLLCVAIILGASQLSATPQTVAHSSISAPASIAGLITASDAVVTGTATGTLTGGTASATISVEKVLKGSPTSGSVLHATWPVSPGLTTPAGSSSTVHGLFYLRQTNTAGEWTALPVMLGSGWFNIVEPIPTTVPSSIVTATAASLPANPSVFDSVAVELVTVVESGNGSLYPDLVTTALEMPSPVFDAAFRRFVGGGVPALVCTGAAGLLAEGDAAIPGTVLKNYAAWSSMVNWPRVILEMATAYVSADSQALATLGSLATGEKIPTDLRVAAGTALAAIHAPASLQALASLLDDPNVDLEAAAVGGLSMFANNVPVRGHGPAAGPWKYRSNDTIEHSAFDEGLIRNRGPYYLQFWKNWWTQNQADFQQ